MAGASLATVSVAAAHMGPRDLPIVVGLAAVAFVLLVMFVVGLLGCCFALWRLRHHKSRGWIASRLGGICLAAMLWSLPVLFGGESPSLPPALLLGAVLAAPVILVLSCFFLWRAIPRDAAIRAGLTGRRPVA